MDEPELIATLCRRGWLFREWSVRTPSGEHIVSYNGRHLGVEFIKVDGKVAVKMASSLWFVPKFEFKIGDVPATIYVRVWP